MSISAWSFWVNQLSVRSSQEVVRGKKPDIEVNDESDEILRFERELSVGKLHIGING